MSVITSEQIAAGAAILDNNKLTASQVDDLVSKFRGFLKTLAPNYPLRSTLEAQEDNVNSNRCAKLAACLLAWQENGFDNGGFAPTNANRTGFNYSIDDANYLIFEYAFGLLWDIPAGIRNGATSNYSRYSTEGYFRKIW